MVVVAVVVVVVENHHNKNHTILLSNNTKNITDNSNDDDATSTTKLLDLWRGPRQRLVLQAGHNVADGHATHLVTSVACVRRQMRQNSAVSQLQQWMVGWKRLW